jgi:hypothetical protein
VILHDSEDAEKESSRKEAQESPDEFRPWRLLWFIPEVEHSSNTWSKPFPPILLRRFGATFFNIDDSDPQLLDFRLNFIFALVAHISVSGRLPSKGDQQQHYAKAPPLEAWESVLNKKRGDELETI